MNEFKLPPRFGKGTVAEERAARLEIQQAQEASEKHDVEVRSATLKEVGAWLTAWKERGSSRNELMMFIYALSRGLLPISRKEGVKP